MQFTQGAGGRFTGSTGSGSVSPQMALAWSKAGGDMSYDSRAGRGTGYGHKGGDARVKLLQQALNRLGMTDSRGRPLAEDGKLGPLTTSAVKKAQRALGIKPADGKVTAALMVQLLNAAPPPKTAPAKPKAAGKMHAKPAARVKPKSSGKPAPKPVAAKRSAANAMRARRNAI